MSDEHKAALARGRTEARAIKRYLDAIAARKPGRPVTPDGLKQRLAKIIGQIDEETDPLRRVDLVQKRIDTEAALSLAADAEDIEVLEQGFTAHAAAYSSRKGISYGAWRETGVPAAVLQRAGIRRTRTS
jgi:hypothetical protein